MPVHNQFLLGPKNQLNPNLLRLKGPVVHVEIQIPTVLAQTLQQQGKPLPQPVTGFCLVDTGASKTCVDAGAVAGLGVSPINRVQVQTPSGSTSQYTYPVRMSFPGTQLPGFEFSSVIGSVLAAQGIVGLLGRDVLSNFLLVYNGPAGLFSLAL
jgi:hypothetical protein